MEDTFWLRVAAKSYESFRSEFDEIPDWNSLKPEHQAAWVKAVRVGVRACVSEGKKALKR